MSFCHECGSEVAENDAFCPYCGITLTPITPVVDEPSVENVPTGEETSYESTIVMSKGDVPQSVFDTPIITDEGKESASPAPEVLVFDSPAKGNDESPEENSFDAQEPGESQPGSSSSEASIDDIASEAADSQTENTDTEQPTPEIASSFTDIPEPIAISGHEELNDKEQIMPSFGVESSEPEVEQHEIEPVEEPVSQASDEEPDHFSEVFSEAEPAAEIEQALEHDGQQVDEDNSESVDEEPEIIEESVDDVAVEEPEEIKPPTLDDSDPGIAGNTQDIFSEREIFRNEGISRPAEELPSDELYKSAPMFDSVRIIEESQNLPMPEPGVDVPEPSENEVKATDEELSAPEEGEGSFTKSNIAGGENDAKQSSKLKPLSEGTLLNNRYEIIRKIGGGGMGAVYLASDNNLGGVLRAVKEMVQSHIEDEQQEKAINDFKRESTILSSLDHPSIPTIFDYFYDEKESRFYLVMKYISGGDLATRLRAAPEGKLSELTITEWAIQILDVLDYLHNLPTTIVYRDLKPSNIMIDGNSGRMMLIDFGIARSINQKEEKGVTAVGTMGYAPPELFSGNVEPRSDIYSLGSTMFHLLTGADPQSNPLLIFDFQKNPLPRQINPQLSDQMELILMRAVEYNAEARFTNAGEMKKALEEHLYNLKGGGVTFGVKEAPKSVSLQNQSVFCGFCGQNIVATDLFCAFCGAKQPIAQHGVHSEIYSQAQQTAKLIIYGTNELQNPSFVLSKDVNLVGRRDPMSNIFPEVDLSKYDPQTKISRRHARIWRDGTNYLVEDLGSSNGTIVFPKVSDAMKLSPNQTFILNNGDQIKIGDTTLHFVFG